MTNHSPSSMVVMPINYPKASGEWTVSVTHTLEKLLKLNDSAWKNKLILQTLIKKYRVLAQGYEKRGKIMEAKTYKEKFQIHSSSLEELVSNQVQ